MKTLIAGIAIGLFGLQAAVGGGADTETDGAKKALVGSWKNRNPIVPAGMVHIKHVTSTHWTWVLYDVKSMTAVATAGGTWSLIGDQYKERIEFSSESPSGWRTAHLRGK